MATFPCSIVAFNAPGGSTSIRRVCAVAVAVMSMLSSAPLGAAGDQRQVTVEERDGLYTVTARFDVSAPASAAVATMVLTDYDNISRFMPDVRRSRVLERTGETVIVEQEAVARALLFSRTIHLKLEVRQSPGVIRFQDRCGRSFVSYQGAWRIAEDEGRVRIEYELVARPTASIPPFVVKRLLRRDMEESIGRLRAEISARAIQAPAINE